MNNNIFLFYRSIFPFSAVALFAEQTAVWSTISYTLSNSFYQTTSNSSTIFKAILLLFSIFLYKILSMAGQQKSFNVVPEVQSLNNFKSPFDLAFDKYVLLENKIYNFRAIFARSFNVRTFSQFSVTRKLKQIDFKKSYN